MPIIFRCQSCNQKLSAPSRKAGKSITCPACGIELTIPAADRDEPEVGAVDESEQSWQEDQQQQQPELDESLQESISASSRQPAVEREPVEFSPPVLPTPDDDDDNDDEGLVLRRAETEFDDMDLTPMVDVTFLLLIFFMITASFSIQKTIHVPPPENEGQAPIITEQEDLEKVSIEVLVDEKNAIFVDDEPLLDPSGLADVIQTKMRQDQKQELLLTQDLNSLHETTVLVIDAANEAGIQKIRIRSKE
jgi:biopolymer transport protein ExbD